MMEPLDSKTIPMGFQLGSLFVWSLMVRMRFCVCAKPFSMRVKMGPPGFASVPMASRTLV